MDAEQKKRPRSGRTPTKTTVRIPFEKRRWRFTRNGRDFGPFQGTAIQEKIQNRELDGETVLFEEWEGRSIKLNQVSEFSRILEVVRREIEQEQLESSTEETREAVKSSSRRRLLIGIAGLTGGAAAVLLAVQFMLDAPHSPASSIARSLFIQEPLAALGSIVVKEEPAEPEEAVVENKQENRDSRRPGKGKRIRNSRGSGSKARMLSTSGGLLVFGSSSSLSLSFEDEESPPTNGGPPFNSRAVTRKVSGKVSQCMKNEGNLRPEFKGGAVSFTLGPKGTLINVKLSDAGQVTSELVACIKRVFLAAKFNPFAGGNQIVKIPVRIQSTSN